MLVTASTQLSGNVAVDSILIRGSNINIAVSQSATSPTTLAIGDGASTDLAGLLDVGFGNSITNGFVNFASTEGVVFVNGDTLTISSGVTGGNAHHHRGRRRRHQGRAGHPVAHARAIRQRQ